MNSKQVWPQAATMWSTTWLIEIQIKVTKAIACVTHYCYYYWLLLLLLIIVVVIDYCYHKYRCLVSPIILITSMFIWVEVISVFWSQVIWSKMISCLGGIRRDHPESSRFRKGRWKENDLWLLVKPILRLSSLVHRSSSILLFLGRQFCRGRSSRRCNVWCND